MNRIIATLAVATFALGSSIAVAQAADAAKAQPSSLQTATVSGTAKADQKGGKADVKGKPVAQATGTSPVGTGAVGTGAPGTVKPIEQKAATPAKPEAGKSAIEKKDVPAATGATPAVPAAPAR